MVKLSIGIEGRAAKRARRHMAWVGVLAGITVGLASISGAYAGADPGTTGSGYTVFPSASPYTSYAYVTMCHSNGYPVLVYEGKARLGTTEAFGPRQSWPGPDSTVTLRRIGSYTGNWYCLAK